MVSAAAPLDGAPRTPPSPQIEACSAPEPAAAKAARAEQEAPPKEEEQPEPPPQQQQQQQQGGEQQQPEPLTFPNPPRLPERYCTPDEVTRWEAVWVAAEDESLTSMPVRPNCSAVLGYLLLGNMFFAKDLDLLVAHGVTHVLSLTKRKLPPEVLKRMDCRQIIVQDTPQAPISETFDGACAHILAAKQAGGKVLVHCRAGVSRGSCAVIAYLVTHYRQTVREAYAMVKARRPIAHPNKGFLGQLLRLEERVHGKALTRFAADELPYTLWERAEHIGLNDPIPSRQLCLECEQCAAGEYARRYGHRNKYLTQDAGLGGKMELHVVEVYSVVDFVWLDPILVDKLYTNRPAEGNYASRRQLRHAAAAQAAAAAHPGDSPASVPSTPSQVPPAVQLDPGRQQEPER